MSFTIVRGNPFAQTRQITQDFDPSRGYSYEYEFDAAVQEPAVALANDYAAQGCETHLLLKDDKASLRVIDPTQQYAIDTWQIQGNDVSVDGLSHPIITAFLTDEMAAKVRAGIQDAQSGTSVPAIIAGILNDPVFQSLTGSAAGLPVTSPVLPTTGQATTLAVFIGLNFRGSPNFLRSQYVLRHTTNVSNRYLLNADDYNVLEIYSINELLAEVTSPVVAPWFPLPLRLFNKLSLVTSNLAEFFANNTDESDIDTNYFLGWLKKPSTESTTAYNRIDITTEYILDLWSVAYYPGVPDLSYL